jgi:hypothetical protein
LQFYIDKSLQEGNSKIDNTNKLLSFFEELQQSWKKEHQHFSMQIFQFFKTITISKSLNKNPMA